MRAAIRGLLVLSVLALNVHAVRAEGWQMPNLNPFSGNGSAGKQSGEKPWLPGWKQATTATSGVWNKVKAAPGTIASGTKKAVSAVNPFKNASSTTKHSRPLTGSNLDRPQPKQSWLPGWGNATPQRDASAPNTVSDWIAGPRPE
jgi:ribosome modulation factor